MNTRILTALVFLAGVTFLGAGQARAATDHTPEEIFEAMAVKCWRGITNVVTCPVELPKQLYTTTRDRGLSGPPVGLLKGVWMTGYRAVCGALEIGLFFVPAPGFYEALPQPAYVWQGWAVKPLAEPVPQP